MKPDRRQGCYLIVAGPTLYVGSTAGGRGRSFSARLDEHLKALATGTHPNKKLQAAYKVHGKITMIPLACVSKGDIELARKIEAALQRVIPGLCNEVQIRNGW